MRLSRIEATRYGLLDGACLSGLGDGLTVVLGPNESGKTTFGALTRHVLYGYPDNRTKERSYASPSGSRAARLFFTDETGEWTIERIDGPHRGPVAVTAVSGSERAGMLGEIVGGVSEQSFRVVFGFGLDELADIERAGTADIVGRLYAAGTGLAVNPLDVKKALEGSAAELYAPRAVKPLVNRLAASQRDIRDRIHVLEEQAASFADEQRRLHELAEEIEPLKTRRDELDERVRIVSQDSARLTDAVAQLDDAAAQAGELERRVTELQRSVELIDVNDRVLAAGPALDSVLAEASAYRARLETLDEAQAQADDAERRARALGDFPEPASDSVENRTAVEQWATRLSDLKAETSAKEAAAQNLEAQAHASERVAAEAAPTAAAKTSIVLSGALTAVLIATGFAIAVTGFLLGQLLFAGLGALVAVVGGIALIVTLVRPKTPSAAAPLSAEAARLRTDAQAARTLADSSAIGLESARAEWRAWLAERRLDAHGEEPAAVRVLLGELQERSRLLAEAAQRQAVANHARSSAEDWVLQLVDVVRSYDEAAGQMPSLAEAGTLAERARRDLERARQAAAERKQMMAELATSRAAQVNFAQRLEASRVAVAQLVTRHALDPDSPAPSLDALLARLTEEMADVRARYEQLSREHAQLQGRLDEEGRTNEMALARQQLEGVRAQAVQGADRYLVDVLAAHLLDRARERFERERQPEVVRIAQRVFSEMTAGRYSGITIPLDNSGVTVLAADGTKRTSEQLSRGTAEQLYLALRVGLISSLGELGRMLPVLMDDVVVNFDPERQQGAVAAVAELAKLRQVLYFTCHPDTAQLLASSVPGATLVNLDRCELRGCRCGSCPRLRRHPPHDRPAAADLERVPHARIHPLAGTSSERRCRACSAIASMPAVSSRANSTCMPTLRPPSFSAFRAVASSSRRKSPPSFACRSTSCSPPRWARRAIRSTPSARSPRTGACSPTRRST